MNSTNHNVLLCRLIYGVFSALLIVSARFKRVLVLPLSFQRYVTMSLLLLFDEVAIVLLKSLHATSLPRRPS